MAKQTHEHMNPRIANRKAFHDYRIGDKLETGIVLQGSEVKSIRHGQVQLSEGFVRVEPNDMSLWLYNADIAPYKQSAGLNGHMPRRARKLLAHKREIQKLFDASQERGATLVPLAMYFVRGKVKVEVGVAHGKQAHDKRQDIKERDARREIERGMTRKRL